MKSAYIIGTGLALLAGYACDAGDSLFSEGGVIASGSGGDDITSGGGSVGQGGNGITVSVGVGGSPSQVGAGGVGEGGKPSAGGGGASDGGAPPGPLECSLPDWCDEADPANCVCTGCNNQNTQCTDGEDCVCPDCHNAQACQGCGMGGPNGICNPYYEGCSCSDCAAHPLCLKD